MSYPAETTTGETVQIVEKTFADPSRPMETEILYDDTGNAYRRVGPQKIELITALVEDENGVTEASAVDAPTDAETASEDEAPAEDAAPESTGKAKKK